MNTLKITKSTRTPVVGKAITFNLVANIKGYKNCDLIIAFNKAVLDTILFKVTPLTGFYAIKNGDYPNQPESVYLNIESLDMTGKNLTNKILCKFTCIYRGGSTEMRLLRPPTDVEPLCHIWDELGNEIPVTFKDYVLL